MGKPEITYGPHKAAFLGEQHVGHVFGEQGFFFVDGPSGGGGHGLTAPGFDGVAYNPKTQELIIYDNKAYKRAGDVSKATAIDPEINLRKNLNDLITHIENHPNLKDMPHRKLILHRLGKTRDAVADWIAKGSPPGGLKLHSKVKLAVTTAWGNSTGVGGKLAKSGAIEFIKLEDAPSPKPTPFLALEAERLAKQADEAAELGVKVVQKEMSEQVARTIGKENAEMFVKGKVTDILGKRLQRIAASKAAKRTASLIPLVGWGFAAKDAYAGVEDMFRGNVWRGLSGVGLSMADVASDFLHLGDLVSGPGGTALSLGVQAATITGQITIEMQRAEERMEELMKELHEKDSIPMERLRDYYELDDEAIQELRKAMAHPPQIELQLRKHVTVP